MVKIEIDELKNLKKEILEKEKLAIYDYITELKTINYYYYEDQRT